MKKPLGFQHIYFILLIFSYHLCKNLSGTIQELQQQWLISAFNSVAGKLIMWRETNWGLNDRCSVLILTCPRHLDRTCPSSRVRTEVRRKCVLGKPTSRAQWHFMTWKDFWMSWMNGLCYEEGKVKSLFYADDMVLLSPTRNGLITVRRNGSGWTAPTPSCHFWQMLSNVELAFIQQRVARTHPFSHAGLRFPTQSSGGLARRWYLLNSRCLWVQC